jgi:hypothetical protein
MPPFVRALDPLIAHADRLHAQLSEVAGQGFAADKGYLDAAEADAQRRAEAALEAERSAFNARVRALLAEHPAAWSRALAAWRQALTTIAAAEGPGGRPTPPARAAQAALDRFDHLDADLPGPQAFEVVALARRAVAAEGTNLRALANAGG